MAFSLWTIKFRPTLSRVPEHHHFEDQLQKVGINIDRIIGSSDREVLVDQVSDLSSSEEAVFFLSFHFLWADPSSEVRILDDSVQC